MATSPQVLCLFTAPDRISALSAIGRTIGCIQRTHALSYVEIAKVLECSPDTVERAARHDTLLNFDTVARLAHFFPECADTIRQMFDPAITAAPPTIEERLERIEREAALIRKEREGRA